MAATGFVVLLKSSPAEATVPPARSRGRLTATAEAYVWQDDEDHRFVIPLADVKARQAASKDGVKLRLVTHAGGAYVFEFLDTVTSAGTTVSATDARASVVKWKIPGAGEGAAASAGGGGGAAPTPLAATAAALPQAGAAAARPGGPASSAPAAAAAPGATAATPPPPPPPPSMIAGAAFRLRADNPHVRAALLRVNRELSDQYGNVVEGGLVTADDFWRMHQQAVIDFTMTRQEETAPSQSVDDIRPSFGGGGGGAGGGGRDKAVYEPRPEQQVRIFLREPRTRDAYLAYVETGRLLSRGDFWREYAKAVEARADAEASEGVPRIGVDRPIGG